MQIDLPGGTMLESLSGDYQSMMVVGIAGRPVSRDESTLTPTDRIVLSDGSEQTYILRAYCAEFEKQNPAPFVRFKLREPDPVMACIARERRVLSVAAIQAAVWIRTDHVTYSKMAAKFPISTSEWSGGDALAMKCAAGRPEVRPSISSAPSGTPNNKVPLSVAGAGTLIVKSPTNGMIVVDGKEFGRVAAGEIKNLSVTPGQHILSLKPEDGRAAIEKITTIAPGTSVVETFDGVAKSDNRATLELVDRVKQILRLNLYIGLQRYKEAAEGYQALNMTKEADDARRQLEHFSTGAQGLYVRASFQRALQLWEVEDEEYSKLYNSAGILADHALLGSNIYVAVGDAARSQREAERARKLLASMPRPKEDPEYQQKADDRIHQQIAVGRYLLGDLDSCRAQMSGLQRSDMLVIPPFGITPGGTRLMLEAACGLTAGLRPRALDAVDRYTEAARGYRELGMEKEANSALEELRRETWGQDDRRDYEAGRFAQAKAFLDKRIATDPSNLLYQRRSLVHLALKDAQAAESDFLKGIEPGTKFANFGNESKPGFFDFYIVQFAYAAYADGLSEQALNALARLEPGSLSERDSIGSLYGIILAASPGVGRPALSDGGGTGGGRPPVSDSLTIVEEEKRTLETTIKVLADSLRKAGFETTWTESKTLDNGSRLNISASKRTRYQVSFDGCRMTLHGDSPLEFRSGSDQLMTPEPRDVAGDIGSMMVGRPSSTGNPVSGEHPNQQGDTDLWTIWLSGVANAKLSVRHTMTFGGGPAQTSINDSFPVAFTEQATAQRFKESFEKASNLCRRLR